MTWTRIKRWIGTHPVAAVLTVTMVSLGLCVAAILLHQFFLSGAALRNIWWDLLVLGLLALAALLNVAVAVVTAIITGRAGKPPGSLLCCVAWDFAISMLLFTGLGVHEWVTLPMGEPMDCSDEFVLWGILFVGLSVCHLVGFIVGIWITRRQIARGKWEHTEPVERPREHP